MDHLPPTHLLALPRPAPGAGPLIPPGAFDTSTLAAHDFDVDTRTGFMPPQPPLARLPAAWERWEATLDAAAEGKLQLGSTLALSEDEADKSAQWRNNVENVS